MPNTTQTPTADRLQPEQLKAQVSLEHLLIETSDDLEGVSGFLGQPRAKDSLEFGIAMRGSGYNLYVMGA
ncbi:MAG: hypothetical protein WD601_07535, partial [Pseudohongiellaceae bacterium]